MLTKTLDISTSPHIVKGSSTDNIMLNVVIALVPIAAFSIYSFGLNALLLLSVTTISCVLTEHFLNKWSGKSSPIGDWSAVITGLLLGMTLPPIFPLWMGFVGGVLSIALGKFIFGGLGYNVFNPALVGRAVMQAAFPVAITTWAPAMSPDRFTHISSSTLALPFLTPAVDVVSGATPLSAFKFDHVLTDPTDLALGMISGSSGETCGILIILGGIYLAVRKMLDWRIPVSILGSVTLFTAILYWVNPEVYPSPLFMLFSGGLMLGAFFMATDMVSSPITPFGVLIYGVIIGLITAIIRIWGGLPDGVMYAILLGNAFAPHIDGWIKPRVYGTNEKQQEV